MVHTIYMILLIYIYIKDKGTGPYRLFIYRDNDNTHIYSYFGETFQQFNKIKIDNLKIQWFVDIPCCSLMAANSLPTP